MVANTGGMGLRIKWLVGQGFGEVCVRIQQLAETIWLNEGTFENLSKDSSKAELL